MSRIKFGFDAFELSFNVDRRDHGVVTEITGARFTEKNPGLKRGFSPGFFAFLLGERWFYPRKTAVFGPLALCKWMLFWRLLGLRKSHKRILAVALQARVDPDI